MTEQPALADPSSSPPGVVLVSGASFAGLATAYWMNRLGYCVSPVAGMGGSMAIIGATRLADALRRRGPDHAAAFRDYHDGLRPLVEDVQERAVSQGMVTMFPADEAELAERDRKLGHGALEL